jgi:hypothetical protein
MAKLSISASTGAWVLVKAFLHDRTIVSGVQILSLTAWLISLKIFLGSNVAALG